ncbi:right-handed parallel beta-helix repeat-containing protein, partial [Candidatus Micrarchaeota archaeon]|nr:right-handed parallel beta-helix repeat-containing protein [Candidatus Micrarchaeota archaeon]
MVVVAVITVAANDRLGALAQERMLSDAKSAVADLARTANLVYHRGWGSYQNVYINIPSSADLSSGKSFIANRTISLRVQGSDISSRTEAQVSGAFPSTTGGAWLKVQSRGSYVSIGNFFLDINRTSLYLSLPNGTSKIFPITIYNRGNATMLANISTDLAKYSGSILFSISPSTSIEIGALSSAEMNLTIFAYPTASGIYPGVMTFIATNATGSVQINERLQIPLAIDVSLPVSYFNISGISSLSIIPSQWNVRLAPSNSSEQLFFLTTGGSSIAVETTLNAPTSPNWEITGLTPPLYNISASDPPGPGTRTIGVTFSADATSGSYLGTLNATADNEYVATTILNFTIDGIGPSASNLSSNDTLPQGPVRVALNATELLGGTIANCQVSVDAGAYESMNASDGLFGSSSEEAYLEIVLSEGAHTIYARCLDDLGNWGNATNLSISLDSQPPSITIDQISALLANVSVNATASDALAGGQNISWCNVTFLNEDNGASSTLGMQATDDALDSHTELVFASTSLSYGLYNVSVSCADSYGNIANTSAILSHNITACASLDTTNTVYRLGNDVTSAETCFTITASNVTLDCQGNAISGENATNTYGAYSDQQYTTIKDCIISNFSSAIYYYGASDGSILNNSASTTYEGGYGIVLSASSDSNTIEDNIASSNNGSGIYVYSSALNTLSGNAATGVVGQAITLYGASSSTFTNNSGTSASSYGIYLFSSSGNTLSGNTVSSTSSSAIHLSNSNYTLLFNNTINSSTTGISIAATASSNIFHHNYIYRSLPYINNSGTGNEFNTSVLGVAQGNYYENIANLSLYDYDGDSYGDFGAAYPYSAASSNGKWEGEGADWGPINATSTGVNACIALSTAGSTYTLSSPLSSNGTCFTVTAANILLDCRGFSLTGDNSSGSYGIYSTQLNTTIMNCIISNFEKGIYFSGANRSLILNTSASSTSGIYLAGKTINTVIANSTGNGTSGQGIMLDTGSFNQILFSNGSSVTSIGIYLLSGEKNNLTNTTGSSISSSGIRYYASNQGIIENSTAISVSASGLEFQHTSSSGIKINKINATSSSGSAIASIYGGVGNVFSGGTATSATGNGIYAASSSLSNIFANMTIFSSSGVGVLINSSRSNNFTGNNISSTSGYGIWGISGSNNTLIHNNNITGGGSQNALRLDSSHNNTIT